MNYAITIEVRFFLISILCGALVLLVYDVLRILRRIIKHNYFFIAVEDLIFWVTAGIFIFVMMYRENDGIIRSFSIMGMAIGMVLYHYILSGFIVYIITKLIRALLRPFGMAINMVKKLLRFLNKKIGLLAHFIEKRLKKRMNSVKIALNKRKRILLAESRKKSQQLALEKKKRQDKRQAKRRKAEKARAEKRQRNNANDADQKSGKRSGRKSGQKPGYRSDREAEPGQEQRTSRTADANYLIGSKKKARVTIMVNPEVKKDRRNIVH